MYFPSYIMCKIAIEQLSFILFLLFTSEYSLVVGRARPAEPGQSGQPGLSGEPGQPSRASRASRAYRVCRESRASRRLHIDIIYNEGS